MRHSKLFLAMIVTAILVSLSGCQKTRGCGHIETQALAGAPTIDWDEYNTVEAIETGFHGFDYTPLIGQGDPYPNYNLRGKDIKVTGWIRGGEFAYRYFDGKFILTDVPGDTLETGTPQHRHLYIEIDWQVKKDTAICNAIRERLLAAKSHKCYIKGKLDLGQAGNNPHCRTIIPLIMINNVNDFQYEE